MHELRLVAARQSRFCANRPKEAVLATPQRPRRWIFLSETDVMVSEHCVVACHRLVCQGSRKLCEKIVAM
mgnify:CR=1 FL=1